MEKEKEIKNTADGERTVEIPLKRYDELLIKEKMTMDSDKELKQLTDVLVISNSLTMELIAEKGALQNQNIELLNLRKSKTWTEIFTSIKNKILFKSE
ncbi:hypothetical protein [Flavobacterium caseinilyticum]|uniref:Uncharacterized protein n=1 Tax=Flavobacterium caseinilyticum TaxID=2541732 RepID=A0A4R5AWG3_9FLAO|nr:hypothetical protein [Flavobacterium caseinilyticum]TDD77163.1 hypothetical protein E0F89_06065 [Flavobacterium caseinilyticum]